MLSNFGRTSGAVRILLGGLLGWLGITSAIPVAAQSTGSIIGTVTTDSSAALQPLPGVHVFLEETSIGAITDGRGAFALQEVPAGSYRLVARFVGYETVTVPVTVAGETVRAAVVMHESTTALDEIVVSAIGERQSRANVPVTIQSIGRAELERVRPAHPSEVMGRLPGVWVNTTSGEGHMTAIRQPITTDPVYLFLENGIPVRSTGFFNHNALYEVNLPMAADVEVLKGPGTALYGSDAIGGVVNVTTRRAPEDPAANLTLEGGSAGFGRLMLGTGTTTGRHGLRLDLNATRSDGWRDASGYDRQTGTLTWSADLPGASQLRTLASFSVVDQKPAGASSLREEDFERDPTLNYTPISYREVQAFRVSSAYERATARTLLGITPYFRYNEMSILPNWSLAYDPTVYTTQNYSVGLQASYRVDLDPVRLVGGIDMEASPGRHEEWIIEPEREGSIYTGFERAGMIYDYDVAFREASPFVHAELALTDRLRLSAGLRADLLAYDYDNRLGVLDEGPHRRAPSTVITYRHLSPKLGLTYRVSNTSSAFLSYRHAFRVPSEGQLFRQGSTSNTLSLEPVKANNYEVGLRLQPLRALRGEVSVYHMRKVDDIVTYVDRAGVRISTNAGETSHTGVEVGLQLRPGAGVELQGAFSYARHRFEYWQPSAELNLSGNEMDGAPRTMASFTAAYSPSFWSDFFLSLDVNRLGSYWMDAENTIKYDGHTLVSLRGSYELPYGLTVFGRVTNLTDAVFAERATFHPFRGEEIAPGQPRAVYLGVEYQIGRGEGR